MKLRIFCDFCAELETFWKALEPFSQHYVFQSYEWLNFGQKTVGEGPQGVTPWIGVVFDDLDDQPRMIFPLGFRRILGARVLEFIGGGQSDYLGPLVHNNWVSDMPKIRSAWDMVRNALPPHDVRHFAKLPACWSETANPMLEIWGATFQDNAYAMQLPESFEAFQARLRPKFRQDTKRQRRRLQGMGALDFEVIDSSDSSWNVVFGEMIEQKRQRYRATGVPDIFSDDKVQQFYRVLPERFSGEGKIHFSFLKLGNEILAAHWGAIHRGRFYYIMPTFKGGKWHAYSTGRLLLENLVEWCIQNGLKVFDCTIGGEDYKKDWCDSVMPLFEHLHLVTPRGLPYLTYVRLQRRAKRNDRVWKGVKFIYSWYRYGRLNGKKS